MYAQAENSKDNKGRVATNSAGQKNSSKNQGLGFVGYHPMATQLFQNFKDAKHRMSQLKVANSAGNPPMVIQREYAEATCTVAETSKTINSKGNYIGHWVSNAMNTTASVKPKKVPGDKEGEWVEAPGNELFQCAEPKSLSWALRDGLASDQITEDELLGIYWNDIKWKDGERDNKPAKPCPTCLTWMSGRVGSAEPSDEALEAVRKAGRKNDKYFETDEERDEFNESARRRLEFHKQYGQYIKALISAGIELDQDDSGTLELIDANKDLILQFIKKRDEEQTLRSEASEMENDIKALKSKQKSTKKAELSVTNEKLLIVQEELSSLKDSVIALFE